MTSIETAKLMAILDRDEFALAVHTHISGLPLVTAARALGWTVLRVDRTRKRLQRKLEQFSRTLAPPTRRMVDDVPGFSFPDYLERLPSGRRLWSMRHLPASYLDVIQEGILIVELPNQLIANETSRTSHGRATNMKSIDQLRKELNTERALLDRIGERIHATFLAVDECERRLYKAQRALALAIKESPSTVKSFHGAIAIAKTDLAARTPELSAARTEAATQTAKIIELEGELAVRELEARRAAFAPVMKDLYAAFDVIIAAAAKVDEALMTIGPSDLTELLFPLRQTSGWPDYEKQAMRNHLIAIFNAATKAQRVATAYDPVKELAG